LLIDLSGNCLEVHYVVCYASLLPPRGPHGCLFRVIVGLSALSVTVHVFLSVISCLAHVPSLFLFISPACKHHATNRLRLKLFAIVKGLNVNGHLLTLGTFWRTLEWMAVNPKKASQMSSAPYSSSSSLVFCLGNRHDFKGQHQDDFKELANDDKKSMLTSVRGGNALQVTRVM